MVKEEMFFSLTIPLYQVFVDEGLVAGLSVFGVSAITGTANKTGNANSSNDIRVVLTFFDINLYLLLLELWGNLIIYHWYY
jgi:hypothetical protein